MSKKRAQPASLGELAAGHLRDPEGLKRLESPHPAVRHIVEMVERLQARPYTTHAVITGEPGTGKEGLAHTLHELMHPEDAPVYTVNVAGRDERELVEELFGAAPRARGERNSDGLCAEADGGSLILDEIMGTSPAFQRRLLELAKKGRYHREGEDRARRTQVSLIVISDGDLRAEVAAGRLRHDLFHKLARLELTLPPLRERFEDIPAAAVWMANRTLASRSLAPAVEIEPDQGEAPSPPEAVIFRREALEALRGYAWPGNFRELEIVVERALMLYSDGKQITAHDVRRALPRGR